MFKVGDRIWIKDIKEFVKKNRPHWLMITKNDIIDTVSKVNSQTLLKDTLFYFS